MAIKTTFDKSDLPFVKSVLAYDSRTGIFTWKVNRGGAAKAGEIAGTDLQGYIRIRVSGGFFLAHRLAWFYETGEWPDKDIDHINRALSDNRISNLRLCTNSENMANKKTQYNNKAGLKGASWDKKSKKWKSQIAKDGKKYHLGFFNNPMDAHNAYVAAAERMHGEFARAA